jgi:hypothetical protein
MILLFINGQTFSQLLSLACLKLSDKNGTQQLKLDINIFFKKNVYLTKRIKKQKFESKSQPLDLKICTNFKDYNTLYVDNVNII